MPADSARRATRTPLLLSAHQPVRIFSVTGTSTAFTTASRISATSASSRSRAEPAALLHTFLAGQPMLMSMISAPISALRRAASASISASPPAICTVRGPGSPRWSMRSRDLRVCQRLGSEVTISPTTSPAPSRRQSCRKGRSVTPAMGARITRLARAWSPIWGRVERVSGMAVDGVGQRGAYHTPPAGQGEVAGRAVSAALAPRGAARRAAPSPR